MSLLNVFGSHGRDPHQGFKEQPTSEEHLLLAREHTTNAKKLRAVSVRAKNFPHRMSSGSIWMLCHCFRASRFLDSRRLRLRLGVDLQTNFRPPHASWIRGDCVQVHSGRGTARGTASRFLDSRRLRHCHAPWPVTMQPPPHASWIRGDCVGEVVRLRVKDVPPHASWIRGDCVLMHMLVRAAPEPPHASWIRGDCVATRREQRAGGAAASRFLDSRRLRLGPPPDLFRA